MGWFHSFELPDGTRIEGYNTLEILKNRYARFPIPAELSGKRVLDVGAWDGWFSFEAERRGAEVTAVDCVEIANFIRIHKALSSNVLYRILDFYELPHAGVGRFDFLFFLGVLYHLKHPLLALEIVCGLTKDTAIVESYVTDADTWRDHRNDVPTMEFYEIDELGNQLDNWIGPTVGCLMAMCRAAGFARVELMYAAGFHAGVACYRKWEPVPIQTEQAPPEVLGVVNTRNGGVNFSTRKEEYITCWFRTPLEIVAPARLRFEVSGLGVPALYVRLVGDGTWVANFRLPPGLDGGWNAAGLRFSDSGLGRTFRIAIDMPLKVDRLVLRSVCDGINWSTKEITVRERECITCWVHGLSESADRSNVSAHLGDTVLEVEYVGEPDLEGCRQVNAVVAGDVARGETAFSIESAGVSSASWALKLVS